MSVLLCQINVKTAEPIFPKYLMATHQSQGRFIIYKWLKRKNITGKNVNLEDFWKCTNLKRRTLQKMNKMATPNQEPKDRIMLLETNAPSYHKKLLIGIRCYIISNKVSSPKCMTSCSLIKSFWVYFPLTFI